MISHVGISSFLNPLVQTLQPRTFYSPSVPYTHYQSFGTNYEVVAILFILSLRPLLSYFHPLVTSTEPHTSCVHLIGIRIRRRLRRRQLFRGGWAVGIIVSAIEMGHLMQDTARLIIIIIRAGRCVLREVPVSIIWAGHNGVVARNRVEQRFAIRAVAVNVGTGDFRGRRLHAFDVGVNGADFGFLRGGLEPDGKIISSSAGCGVRSSSKGDSIGNAGLEGASLGGGA